MEGPEVRPHVEKFVSGVRDLSKYDPSETLSNCLVQQARRLMRLISSDQHLNQDMPKHQAKDYLKMLELPLKMMEQLPAKQEPAKKKRPRLTAEAGVAQKIKEVKEKCQREASAERDAMRRDIEDLEEDNDFKDEQIRHLLKLTQLQVAGQMRAADAAQENERAKRAKA